MTVYSTAKAAAIRALDKGKASSKTAKAAVMDALSDAKGRARIVAKKADTTSRTVAKKSDTTSRTVAKKAASTTRTAAKKAASTTRIAAKKAETTTRTAAKKAETTTRTAAKKATSAVTKAKRRVTQKRMTGGGDCSSDNSSGMFSGVSSSQYASGMSFDSTGWGASTNCALNSVVGSDIGVRNFDTMIWGQGIADGAGKPFSL